MKNVQRDWFHFNSISGYNGCSWTIGWSRWTRSTSEFAHCLGFTFPLSLLPSLLPLFLPFFLSFVFLFSFFLSCCPSFFHTFIRSFFRSFFRSFYLFLSFILGFFCAFVTFLMLVLFIGRRRQPRAQGWEWTPRSCWPTRSTRTHSRHH